MVSPIIAITLHTDIAILGVQNLSIRRPGALSSTLVTILSAWGHLGGPWGQQEGHMGAQSVIFNDLGVVIWGYHFESFLDSDRLNSMFLLELVSRSLFASILSGIIVS